MSHSVLDSGRTVKVAWSDPATRRAEVRRLVPTVAAAGAGLLAGISVPVLFASGITAGGWGLFVMVALAGVAGGCLVAVAFGLAAHRAVRRTLATHPWRQAPAMIGHAGVVTVIGPEREQDFSVGLPPGQHLGPVGAQRDFWMCGEGGMVVFGLEPGLRLRMARERVRIREETGLYA